MVKAHVNSSPLPVQVPFRCFSVSSLSSMLLVPQPRRLPSSAHLARASAYCTRCRDKNLDRPPAACSCWTGWAGLGRLPHRAEPHVHIHFLAWCPRCDVGRSSDDSHVFIEHKRILEVHMNTANGESRSKQSDCNSSRFFRLVLS